MRVGMFLIGLLASGAAVSAQWQPIATESTRRIEFDAASIERGGDGKVTVWGRLVLERPIPDPGGPGAYRILEARNRYDCVNRRFTTLKRVYRSDEATVLREEAGAVRGDIPVRPGTLDDRIMKTVCTTEAMAKGQAEHSAKPKPVSEPAPVEEKHAARGETAPSASPGEEAGQEAPQEKIVKRPNFIQLPKMIPEKPKPLPGSKLAEATPPAPSEEEKAALEAQEKLRKANEALVKKYVQRAAVETPAGAQAPTADSHAAAPAAARAPAVMEAKAEPAPKKAVAKKRVVRRKPAPKPAPVKHEPDYSHVHWSYSGPGGPENWHKLKPEYALCGKGQRQSPIDIRYGVRVDLPPIAFDYHPSMLEVVDNGHTIQVNYGFGSGITVIGKRYDLVQFHFHKPSEERVNGRPYDMVAHLVHRSMEGDLAVVAVLMDAGGLENPFLQTVWNYLPLESGRSVAPPDVAVDLMALLPADKSYFTYLGSLTTPPCTENVLWMVLKQPVQISREQLMVFHRLYPMNARPVQGSHGRLIKESR